MVLMQLRLPVSPGWLTDMAPRLRTHEFRGAVRKKNALRPRLSYDSTMTIKALTTVNENMATAPLPTRLWLRRVMLWIVIAALASAGIYFLIASEFPTAGSSSVIILLLLAALTIVVYHFLVRRVAMSRLHRRILDAQEGKLQTVSIPHGVGDPLHRVLSEFNILVTNLRTTLKEIDESQSRVIGERNRNNAILQSLPGALLCVDSDLRISLSNGQAGSLFEPAHTRIMGESLFDVLALDTSGREILRDAFLYETHITNKEIQLRIGGETRYFALNLSFYKSRNPKELGAVVILHDISEYKRLQETTYTTEKLLAMGQLAAGVAHELNTPLGNIIGYAQLINEAIPDGEHIHRYTNIVTHEARRCSHIIQELLNYARGDGCQLETCSLNLVIENIIETIINCQGQRLGVAISHELTRESPIVLANAGQLEIVLVNLITNAIQAARGKKKEGHVRVCAHAGANRYATVIIEDNGPGVPPEFRHRIFDPFFTTKEVGQGTGLGLAISQALVSRLGGSLEYDSSFKDGARFILALRRATQEPS
jgi:two-component system NtrC family sensor kinase